MASRPGSTSLFDTEADSPPAKKQLTAAKFKLLARACIDNDLGAGSVYRVLFYAVEKAGAGGRFWKKNSDIAREIGVDRATVIRALNKLTLGGYIERIGQHGKLGHRCNVYRIALDLDGAVKAAKREGRRRTSRGPNKEERLKAALLRGLAIKIPDPPWRGEYQGEQAANSTEKPPLRSRNPATLGVATSPPQESQPCNTISTLPMNPSLEPLRIASLEGEKQVVQQGSSEGFEDGASIGKNVASVTIPPCKPLPPLDLEDPGTSSPDEPLSSTLTADREAPGADGDHAQRLLGPMLVLTGGLEKKATALDDAALAPLLAAKKIAVAALGQTRFVQWDIDLTRHLHLAAVPTDVRDGVRRLKYIEWADELADAPAPMASGGAA